MRIAGCFGVLVTALLLGGCAAPSHNASRAIDFWSGRLSVRVDSEPAQSFYAGFDLHGNARQGQMSLYSPLGATLAQLTWSPDEARLHSEGKEQAFASLEALMRHVMGTELPVTGLFAWLAGQPANPDGWIADLKDRESGKLVARRLHPVPAVELRLVLE
jgi:outer membrane lipoprotein LolB